jgi:formyltetrahydrofolate hydrolase
VVILVTKEAHCLGDLLMKANYGGVMVTNNRGNIDIQPAVIGFHQQIAEAVGLFRHQGRFFMRTELEGIFNDAILLADLDSALPEGSIRELKGVMVTNNRGNIDIQPAVIGFHQQIAEAVGLFRHHTLRPLVERFGIPFELVSHEGLSREEHDKQMGDAIR